MPNATGGTMDVMPKVKIGPKHQVTIPQEVFEDLRLRAGDLLEAETRRGQIIFTPLQVVAKTPAVRLTAAKQRVLKGARAKIERIQRDLLHTKGLTDEECKLAAKAGLIDPEQAYWWTEAWQKRERQAEADLQAGRALGPFDHAADLINALKPQ